MAGKTAVARFEGIDDRSAAEALRGSLIEIDRAAAAAAGGGRILSRRPDRARRRRRDTEAPSARSSAVENYGAGDLLEIELEDGKRSLIPFRHGIADLEDGRIVLDRRIPRLAAASRPRPTRSASHATAAPRAEVIADRRRGDAAFAHRMADLVEAVDHVAGGVEARARWSAGGCRTAKQPSSASSRSSHLAELGMRVGTQRRIDAVEACNGLPAVSTTMQSPVIATACAGPSTQSMPASFSLSLVVAA